MRRRDITVCTCLQQFLCSLSLCGYAHTAKFYILEVRSQVGLNCYPASKLPLSVGPVSCGSPRLQTRRARTWPIIHSSWPS